MHNPSLGLVLVVARDSPLRSRVASDLRSAGFDVVAAHDETSAEHTLRQQHVDAVVVDGRILGTSWERGPGSILANAARLRLVVANASQLEPVQRDLVTLLGARLLANGDIDVLIALVDEALDHSSGVQVEAQLYGELSQVMRVISTTLDDDAGKKSPALEEWRRWSSVFRSGLYRRKTARRVAEQLRREMVLREGAGPIAALAQAAATVTAAAMRAFDGDDEGARSLAATACGLAGSIRPSL